MGNQTFYKYQNRFGTGRKAYYQGKARSSYGRQASGYSYGGFRGTRRKASGSTWNRRSSSYYSSSSGRKKKATGRRVKAKRPSSSAVGRKMDVLEARKAKELSDNIYLGQKIPLQPAYGVPKTVSMHYHNNAERWYFIYPVNEILVSQFVEPLLLAQGKGTLLKPVFLSSVTMSLKATRRVGVEMQASLVKVREGPEGDGKFRQLSFRHAFSRVGEDWQPAAPGKPFVNGFNQFGFTLENEKPMFPRDRRDPEVQELASIAYPDAAYDNDLIKAKAASGALVSGTVKVGDSAESKHYGNAYVRLSDDKLDAKDIRCSWPTKKRIQVCDEHLNLCGDRYVILFVVKPIVGSVELLNPSEAGLPFATLGQVQVKCNIRYGNLVETGLEPSGKRKA